MIVSKEIVHEGFKSGQQVVVPTTCWVTAIVTRMIPSRTAFLMAYEAAIFAHVASSFDQGLHEAIHVHSIGVVMTSTSFIGWLESSPELCDAVVTSFDLGGFGVEFLHGGGGFDCSKESELYCNLWVEAVEEPF